MVVVARSHRYPQQCPRSSVEDMASASSYLKPERGRSPAIRPGGSAADRLEVVTAIALGVMAVRCTVGSVAEPFYLAECIWIYRVAAVLMLPGAVVSLLRPSSWLPLAVAAFGAAILVARWLDGDSPATYFPVLVGVLTAMSATTIRRAAALRALCWAVGALAMLTALLLLIGDVATGGFQERLGYGWSAAYASSMELPRDTPPIFNPNEAALPLAILLSFALSIFSTNAPAFLRAGRWLVTAGAALGLLLAGSRGMTLAGFLGFSMALWASVRPWPRLFAGATVLTVAAALTFGGVVPLKDMGTASFVRSDLSDGVWTLGDRYQIWESSLKSLAEHPFLGAGRELIGGDVVSPHNGVISAGELAGGVGICALLVLTALSVRRVRHSPCFGAPAALCVFAAGLSIDTLTHPLAWAMFGLGCSPAALAMCSSGTSTADGGRNCGGRP